MNYQIHYQTQIAISDLGIAKRQVYRALTTVKGLSAHKGLIPPIANKIRVKNLTGILDELNTLISNLEERESDEEYCPFNDLTGYEGPDDYDGR